MRLTPTPKRMMWDFQTLLPSYLNCLLVCKVPCGASKFGPEMTSPVSIAAISPCGSGSKEAVAPAIWLWNLRYPARILWDQFPLFQSSPTAWDGELSLFEYTE